MAKLGPVDTAAHPEIAQSFDKVQESRGWISNLMKAMAHAPDALQHYQRLGHYARYETELSEIERELTVVTTVRSVPYGWRHHGGLALQSGVTQAQLDALKADQVPADLPKEQQALCAFVLAFSAFKGVPQPVVDELLKYYNKRQIVDIAMISAYYLAAGSLIIGFEVEMEPDEDFQKELDWQKTRLLQAS